MVILKYNNQNCKTINFTGKMCSEYDSVFIKKNNYHRYYGPAIIYSNGNKSWWFNGKRYGYNYINKYNQKQFIKDLNKKWLK